MNVHLVGNRLIKVLIQFVVLKNYNFESSEVNNNIS